MIGSYPKEHIQNAWLESWICNRGHDCATEIPNFVPDLPPGFFFMWHINHINLSKLDFHDLKQEVF